MFFLKAARKICVFLLQGCPDAECIFKRPEPVDPASISSIHDVLFWGLASKKAFTKIYLFCFLIAFPIFRFPKVIIPA